MGHIYPWLKSFIKTSFSSHFVPPKSCFVFYPFSGDRSPWVSCRAAAIDLSNLQSSLWLFCSSSVAFFLVPVLILTCIYLRIFAAASKNSRGIRRNSFHQVSTVWCKKSYIVLGDLKQGRSEPSTITQNN